MARRQAPEPSGDERNRRGHLPPEIEKLLAELGDELPPNLRAEVEELRKRCDANDVLLDPAAVEKVRSRLEFELIQRKYRPRVPLYGMGGERTRSMTKDPHNRKTPPESKTPNSERPRRSYQEDPRYRAFYERLKKEQQQTKPDYDEPPEFTTLDELEQTGWDGTPRPWEPPRIKSPTPIPREVPMPQPATDPLAPTNDLLPGTIFRFDDGSIAIYKDAVSGKDYALLYFLQPDGTLQPQGIFLDQYERMRLGAIPPDLFEAMIRMRRWDRDAVIYHLDRFEYAGYVRALANSAQYAATRNAHTTQRVPHPPSSPQPVVEPEPEVRPRPRVARAITPPPESPLAPVEPAEAEVKALAPEPEPPPPPPPPRDPLERGRVIRINVGGKVWEAVYWTSDEIGPIVAHDTNREWSLMHLDLSRFRDAIEYGELLSEEELEEIERSLARHHHA